MTNLQRYSAQLDPKSNGKGLNAQDREVFDLLTEFTEEGAVAKLDYTWLKDRFGKCQRTIRRILKKLKHLFKINFIRSSCNGGIAEACKLYIKRTPELNKILNSRKKESKNG